MSAAPAATSSDATATVPASAAAASASAATRPLRLLCLCLGNICRSPLAEGILRREIERRGLEGWTVDSAGTSAEHEGDSPDDRSISVAARHGLDIRAHRAQQLAAHHWEHCDFILAMDAANYRNALRSMPQPKSAGAALAKLMMYLPSGDVPDPWYGDGRGFMACYQLLNKHTDHVFASIFSAMAAEGDGAGAEK